MIYRISDLTENNINPVTSRKYDSSWLILALTDSKDYQQMCGSHNGCAYTIKISRPNKDNWEMAVCDFIGFCGANNKNAILVMSETDLEIARKHYGSHQYNEAFLRENEPPVLVHSTSLDSFRQIGRDGMLKSWNILKKEKNITENQPIGKLLGDPADFSDYIMFGSGITGEIIVNSKQQGKIIMDENAEYLTGARLYFDAKKMAGDGLLIRDGCHIKVKDTLPLNPYLIWAATWDTLGLAGRISTPRIFATEAEKQFKIFMEAANP
ncbi:MAG: hypothetical protein K2N63_05405 [Lachnospiraceae bacterium]|nr:hypothetical protein [Lachnospiraceae bacterium]